MYRCYHTWDFKVVHIKRYFALNVFVLTRFHCIIIQWIELIALSLSLRFWENNVPRSADRTSQVG